MEDSHLADIKFLDSDNKALFGVFDGHGGPEVSFQLVSISGGLFPFLIESLKSSSNSLKPAKIPLILKQAYINYDMILFKKVLNISKIYETIFIKIIKWS